MTDLAARFVYSPLVSTGVKVVCLFCVLGLALSAAGICWSVALNPLYGLVVFAGLFFDVVVYTAWLKRRTAWSIVWGGLSGGMPILAGRVLASGLTDAPAWLMMLGILLWIPTHNLTLSIKYASEYQAAGAGTTKNTAYPFPVFLVTCPLPVVSSSRIRSPGPSRRTVPSVVSISTAPDMRERNCRVGHGCQSPIQPGWNV